MSVRSLNKVILIGNLTRDPEMRYTPSGTAVCTFGLATNRGWTTDAGEKKEETEFHRIVAWAKLAEICSKFLTKGRKCYIEGRLQTRSWTSQDGQQRQSTEIVIEDMIILDSNYRKTDVPIQTEEPQQAPAGVPTVDVSAATPPSAVADPAAPKKKKKSDEVKEEKVAPDDIPF